MANLNLTICGVHFKNPIITASGTCGFGREYANFYPLSKLGGIALKGVTLEERQGNPPPRVAETPAGILNSVGLQNPGVDAFIEKHLPWLVQQNTVLISNVAGATIEDYCQTVIKLSETAISMIELNISCPNVKEGGVAFGTSTKSIEQVVGAVRRVCKKPLIVKLSPNVTSIADMARAAVSTGADALSLINTLLGMRIDIQTKRPVLHNNTGGLSGPAVFPVALRMVWEVANAVQVPIIGMGGVATWKNAVEMLMAGASAVQVGTQQFKDPFAPIKIIEGLGQYMDENGIASVSELTKSVKPW